jgi:hypothetical protein
MITDKKFHSENSGRDGQNILTDESISMKLLFLLIYLVSFTNPNVRNVGRTWRRMLRA